ncbi:MAG: VOC family protein [Beijerinckiaceae bacterium]
MNDVLPCLWFDGQAEEAARFYASVIPGSAVTAVHRAPGDYTAGREGQVLIVEFTLAGRPFVALNGGPQFKFTEAISLQLPVETQAELDHLYEALCAVPGTEQCGWVKDKYGLSWQIFPLRLMQLITGKDRARAKRVFNAMASMKRFDISAIEAAAQG